MIASNKGIANERGKKKEEGGEGGREWKRRMKKRATHCCVIPANDGESLYSLAARRGLMFIK